MEDPEPMPPASRDVATGTILIVGASRGLGLGLAREFLVRGWRVVGTVRSDARTALHDLVADYAGRLEIENLDITQPDEITALQKRLQGKTLDIVFVNAGIATQPPEARVSEITTEDFLHEMVTNALSPMRVIESLESLVPRDGLIGAMSSGLGSIADNKTGMFDVYRSSKAALNMFMCSFAAREGDNPRAMLVMSPGWIQTDLGGPHAHFTVEESTPGLVDVLISKRGKPGLEFLDRDGNTVPW